MQLARRTFITGLASLIAAPAIAHADNLMRLRGIIQLRPTLSTRWLASYEIMSDCVLARYDVASYAQLRQLPLPGVYELPPNMVAFLERKLSSAIKEANERALLLGESGLPHQCHVSATLPWADAYRLGVPDVVRD